MVMPCSRSAWSPSSSRLKSIFSPLTARLCEASSTAAALILGDAGAVPQQPADQRRFAVIDRAAGKQLEQRAAMPRPRPPRASSRTVCFSCVALIGR